jgi:hypothetical protein
MSLAWSCFALKTSHMLRSWQRLERDEREAWVEFIQDFQEETEEGAFVDPPEMRTSGVLRRLPLLSWA